MKALKCGTLGASFDIDTILSERDWKWITCARQPRTFFMSILVVRRGIRRANRNAKRREERRAETVRDGSLWSFVAKICLPVS